MMMTRNNCVRRYISKLAVRGIIFILFLFIYIINRVGNGSFIFKTYYYPFLILAYLIFSCETICRFFKNKKMPMSSQKQFCNIRGKTECQPEKKGVIFVVLIWLLVTAAAGILYFTAVIDAWILILICLAYSVADVVCVIFFCPFQFLFMKNKCCNTCRIHNWDMFLILTPLIFIPNIFTLILVLLSFAVLIMWEINIKKYPNSFCEQENQLLQCKKCEHRSCRYKKSVYKAVNRAFFNKNSH